MPSARQHFWTSIAKRSCEMVFRGSSVYKTTVMPQSWRSPMTHHWSAQLCYVQHALEQASKLMAL
eukprot:2807287-Amphidinium_carterae.1